MTDDITFEDVKRKARYGHKDWLCWFDKTGVARYAPKNLLSMKQCLLDSGTKGEWSIVCKSNATGMIGAGRPPPLRNLRKTHP